MTTAPLKVTLIRELDHLSAEQLKAVHQLINTFEEPTVQPTPNQEAVRDVREALSVRSEPLSRTIEKDREKDRNGFFSQCIGQATLTNTGRTEPMKVTYDLEADVLCLALRDEPPLDAVEEPSGVVVSYGEDGEPVSVEFLNAAARNLTTPDELSVTVQTSSPRPKTPTS